MVKPKCIGGMGFKDLKRFNLSLLAKQGWRLSSNCDALVSKVLKARYYRHSNFLDAKIGTRPSFTWRSILAGRDVLLLGMKKRICDGNSTRIQESNWIPGMSNPPILRNPDPLIGETRVCDLICESSSSWNMEVINNLFEPASTKAICEIPLPSYSKPDSWFW